MPSEGKKRKQVSVSYTSAPSTPTLQDQEKAAIDGSPFFRSHKHSQSLHTEDSTSILRRLSSRVLHKHTNSIDPISANDKPIDSPASTACEHTPGVGVRELPDVEENDHDEEAAHTNGEAGDISSYYTSSSTLRRRKRKHCLTAVLMITLGCLLATAFIVIGLGKALNKEKVAVPTAVVSPTSETS